MATHLQIVTKYPNKETVAIITKCVAVFQFFDLPISHPFLFLYLET